MAPLYTVASGAQPSQTGQGVSENSGTLGTVALGATGIAAAGFFPFGKGRLWDRYLAGIRAIESGSPGGVLRTFRTSEFLSPLESWENIAVSANEARFGKYGEFLQKTFDSTGGLTLQRTGSIFGEVRDTSGNVVGMGLQIQAGTQRGAAIADYYARVVGVELGPHEALNDALLRARWAAERTGLRYDEWLERLEPELRQQRLVIGAKLRKKLTVLGHDIALTEEMSKRVARLETTVRLLRAKAASTAGRLNVLLTKPFDIPVIGSILSKIPVIRSMSVRPGTNLEILGRLTKKALIAGAAWKGLEYIDYLRSEGSPAAPILSTAGGAALGAWLFKKPGMVFSRGGLVAGAALGLFAGIAPRFDKGLMYGAATIPADINLARASASEATGITESLQEQEKVTPGLLSGSTALAFAGVGGLAAGIGSHVAFAGKSIASSIKSGTPLYKIFEETRQATSGKLASKIAESSFGKAIKFGSLVEKIPMLKSPIAIGALGGLAAWQILASGLSLLSENVKAAIPGVGLIGSIETEEDLQKIYSGEEEVPIRKGRFWEMGRSTKYSGGNIQYYRPHFLARLRDRAYQKGIYGDESERWEYDPTLHPLKAMFGSDEWKYHYEMQHQYDRPAPLSSTYGENVPFIGPAVAATFGKLFKPRKLIRSNEWLVPGGEGGVPYGGEGYVYRPSSRKEEQVAPELGGLQPGSPVAPEEGTQLFNELMYRRREAIGLPGFIEGVTTKGLLGREEIFENKQTFATMGAETSSEYWLWKHLNLGGALATSEPIRRFIPHRRSYLDTYNPLRNNLPSWVPDDYFIDLKHGNPYEKLPEAELRLPGPGFAALHPELQGVNPENYPLAYKVKILGDIAMYSSSYENMLRQAKKEAGNMSPEEWEMVQETERQVAEKKKKREFAEYRFANTGDLTTQDVTVSEILSPTRFRTSELGSTIVEAQGVGAIADNQVAMDFATRSLLGKKISLAIPALDSRAFDTVAAGPRLKAVPLLEGQDYGRILSQEGIASEGELEDEFAKLRFSANERLAGRIGEFVLHGIETPLESLTPISPAAKLIRQRSAVEEYVASEAIGTDNAFWDKPVENFLRPAANMALYKFGIKNIPKEIQERRGIEEYFDMLEWVKYSRLSEQAKREGDTGTAAKYRNAAGSTLFGADVYGNPFEAMRALPRRERDFFEEFSGAQTAEEQQQILSLIPENEQRVYLSQWLRQSEEASLAKTEAKLNTEEDDQIIAAASMLRASEGFAFTEDEVQQWYEETKGRMPLDQWIRERRAKEYFATHSLPDPSWLGWNPAVDMDDVKLKYVEMAGKDYHDFDLWDPRKRALARKPYINEQLILDMAAQAGYTSNYEMSKNSRVLQNMYGNWKRNILTSSIDADLGGNTYNIDVRDERQEMIRKAYAELGA